jgi:hypothetical protein
MILPIKAGDPRRSLATGQLYQDMKALHHRLDIIANIPFDIPLVIIQSWSYEGFPPCNQTLIVQVQNMDNDNLICLHYADDMKYLIVTGNLDDNIRVLPLTGVLQWRLLDSAFLGTTINYPVKTSEYPNLFNMEL